MIIHRRLVCWGKIKSLSWIYSNLFAPPPPLCQRIIQYLAPACKWLRLYIRLLFAASSVFFVENAARAGAAGKYLTLAATFIHALSKKILFLF
jgi:hypothetical protein